MATIVGQRPALVIDEKILLAAAMLPGEGFTAEELIVATFRRFPNDFSLMGFPEFPDSNKVLTQITTSGRGLQRRGWLVKIGTKRYQLTPEAYRHLDRLGVRSEVPGVVSDNRDLTEMMLHWLETQAFDQFRKGHVEEINERQALSFWNLTSGSTAARARRMLAITESAASLLEDSVKLSNEVKLRHDRRLSPQEAQSLLDLNNLLKNRFRAAISFLKNQRR